jgi:lactate dehydrogenase-like 2-hydroxyacid dehydrogenase
MKPRLVVARQMPPSVGARIREEFDCPYPDGLDCDADTALRLLEETKAEALIFTSNLKMNADLVARLPARLKIAATCSVGYDHVDVAAFKARGLIVTNTPKVLDECTADLAFTLMLGAARRVKELSAVMQDGWRRGFGMGEMLGVRVWGKTVGILGMGGIGRAFAARARGFGMKVVYCNRSRLSPELEQGATWFADLRDMLPQCDFLSLHAPATAETKKIINAETLALLPKGAIVINSARGALVDEEALIAALTNGHLTAAGLDVFDNEPAYDLRFRDLPNAFILPHMGSATNETRRAMGDCCLDNIQAVLAGRPPLNPLWS